MDRISDNIKIVFFGRGDSIRLYRSFRRCLVRSFDRFAFSFHPVTDIKSSTRPANPQRLKLVLFLRTVFYYSVCPYFVSTLDVSLWSKYSPDYIHTITQPKGYGEVNICNHPKYFFLKIKILYFPDIKYNIGFQYITTCLSLKYHLSFSFGFDANGRIRWKIDKILRFM